MPNRIIREAILSSEKMALLDWPEEVFYRRILSIVDDYGRCEANPKLLRSRCYPLQTDAVRVTDISRWMAACQKAGLILYYAVQGKQYLEVINFGQQRRSASKCPAPPAIAINCEQASADAHLGVSVSVSEDEEERVEQPSAAKPLVAPCPHEKLIDLFAEHLPMLPKPRAELWDGTRARDMRSRWRWVLTKKRRNGKPYAETPEQALDFFDRFFGYVEKSDFLTGRNGKWPGCTLAWLMESANFAKVLEGNFDAAPKLEAVA